jgi:hypothetical protein
VTQSFSRLDPFHEEQAAQLLAEREAGARAPETLDEMGHALLDIVVAAALAKGITLPGRQAVYTAPIPADCEQVAVLFTGWTPTPPPDGPTICKPWRWIANYSVIITRCSPAVPGKGKAQHTVTVDQLNASAKMASDDAEVFLEAMNRLNEVGYDVSVVTNSPSGGFQTVELNVPLISGGSFL